MSQHDGPERSEPDQGKRRRRRSAEPPDAHRGLIAPLPATHEEAAADREMAAAHRDVAQGRADESLAARVRDLTEQRSHEQRRRTWMSNPH